MATSGSSYSSYNAPNIQFDNSGAGLESLADDFGRLNIRTPNHQMQKNFVGTSMDGRSSNIGSGINSRAGAQVLYQLEDGTVVYGGSPQYNYQHYNQSHLAVPFLGQYQNMGYNGVPNNTALTLPNGSRNQSWMTSQTMPPVPELMNHRRSSWSSNEEASPQTPAFGGFPSSVYISNRSPATWSTPSPMSANQQHYYHIARDDDGEARVTDFWEWTQQEPAIPSPVPARHSGPDGGRGSLDKILDNPDGTTNVYVRGLQPDTTDKLLGLYGKRFGEIDTQKAIIDHSTDKCKGFGFIKYHSYIHAENCIRAFYLLGYEAKFARESHNSRLKALSDTSNTNLYISNLPKLINEDGLKSIFASVFPLDSFPQYRAGSCKILKDNCGISRGVGFARFETPEICDHIVATFNNKLIGEGPDATALQVRYADTQKQKELKAQTAVKRQFKADEYNEAVYGIPFPGVPQTSPPYQTPVHAPSAPLRSTWVNPSPASSISPSDYVGYPNSVLRARRTSSGLAGLGSGNLAQSAHIKIESPSVLAAAKKAAAEAAEDTSTEIDSSTKSDRAQVSSDSTFASAHPSEINASPSKAEK